MRYYVLLLLFALTTCSIADTDKVNPDKEPSTFYLHPEMFTDRKVSYTTEYTDETGVTKTLPWIGSSSGDKVIIDDDTWFKVWYSLRIVTIDVDTRISYTDKTKEVTYEAPAQSTKYTLKLHNHRVTNIRAERIQTYNLHPEMFTNTSTIKYTDENGTTTTLQWTGENGDEITEADSLFSVYYASSDAWIYNVDISILYSDKTKEVTYKDKVHRKKYTLKIQNHRVTDILAETIPLPPSTGKLTFEMFKHNGKVEYFYTVPGDDFLSGNYKKILNASSATKISVDGDLTTIKYDKMDRAIIINTSVPHKSPNDIVTYTVESIPYKVTIVDNIVTKIDTRTK